MDDVVFVLGSEATRAAVDALTIRKKLNAEKLKVYVEKMFAESTMTAADRGQRGCPSSQDLLDLFKRGCPSSQVNGETMWEVPVDKSLFEELGLDGDQEASQSTASASTS